MDSPRDNTVVIVVLAAIIIAMIVVAATTRPERHHRAERYASEPDHWLETAPDARPYAELREHEPGAMTWAQLAAGMPAGSRRPGDRAQARAERASRRAFDGAPPTIPHPIDPRRSGSCLSCHEAGVTLPGGALAPVISHPPYAACTQCHVPAAASLTVAAGERGPTPDNSFVGRSSRAGTRAWPGAPPTMPHTSFMRERCESCHVSGYEALATSHPERSHCRQCHASSAIDEQGPPR